MNHEYKIALAALAAASYDKCGGADELLITAWLNQGRRIVEDGVSLRQQARERDAQVAARCREIMAERGMGPAAPQVRTIKIVDDAGATILVRSDAQPELFQAYDEWKRAHPREDAHHWNRVLELAGDLVALTVIPEAVEEIF